MKTPACLALAVALMLTACSGNSDRSAGVPLPRAFYRIDTYPADYSTIRLADVSFGVNSAVPASSPRPGWLDVEYPRYGAAMHITVRRLGTPDSLAAAIANRHERIELNAGGRSCRTDVFNNDAGFACEMVVAREPAPVPVQFMACDSAGTLAFGVVALDRTPSSADSVAPVLHALENDVFHLLQSLRP